MVNHYIFKHGLSEEKILEIALDRVLEKTAAKKKSQHDTDFSAHWKSGKKLLTGFRREPGPAAIYVRRISTGTASATANGGKIVKLALDRFFAKAGLRAVGTAQPILHSVVFSNSEKILRSLLTGFWREPPFLSS
jgi:hypothetical protein